MTGESTSGLKMNPAIPPSRVEYAIRNRFNPIRDFTPERLASQLDLFHTGHVKDAARTWEAMERRDIYLGNVAAKRKKACARLSYEILTTEDSDDAQKQAKYLEDFYKAIRVTSVLEQNESGGLSLLIRQMMDAVGKRFAVHEIVWIPENSPDGRGIHSRIDTLSAQFRFCPLWWFENKTGRLRYLPEESALEGEEMRPGEWLVTVGEGIMESCSVFYVFKHLPLKDWLAFSEKFGMPGLLGKTNAAKDSAEWEAMEEAVGNFASDWAAVCSANDAIDTVEVKGGTGNLPFPPLVEYCDRAMAARWRGADLSTISANAGTGQGASLQGEETELLLEDDARMVSETLNEQVDRHVIEYKFGAGAEIKAYIKVLGDGGSQEDKKFRRDVWLGFQRDGTVNDIMANLTDLKELTGEVGLPVNQEYIDPYLEVTGDNGRRVTGELVKDAAGDIIGAKTEENEEEDLTTKTAKSAEGLENVRSYAAAVRRDFARAVQRDLKPVAERLQRIAAMSSETERRAALMDLLNELPRLKEMALSDPSGAAVLEDAMARALLAGWKSGKKAK